MRGLSGRYSPDILRGSRTCKPAEQSLLKQVGQGCKVPMVRLEIIELPKHTIPLPTKALATNSVR